MVYEVDYVRIKWIEFTNTQTGLTIERIKFFDDVTLLVGLSGVGKSQILNAVEYTLELAIRNDIELKPYRVGIGICVDNVNYEWFYELGRDTNERLLLDNQLEYCFVQEKLFIDGDIAFERNQNNITVVGYDKVPQPKKTESLILQYSEEVKFEKLIEGIRKLYSVEMEMAIMGRLSTENFGKFKSKVAMMIEKNGNEDFRPFSHLPVPLKLFIAKRYFHNNLYIKIFEYVKELFMEIEDIDIVEDEKRELLQISIQVYGERLLQDDISNGMIKTIYYIVELFTMSEDSLVLIDEFENGLGVNCIDLLSEILLNERQDLQFIITSHHPKIINGIDMNRWKIIDRECKNVKNMDCDDYGIGNSQHDAYFNLINRWEYEGKI